MKTTRTKRRTATTTTTKIKIKRPPANLFHKLAAVWLSEVEILAGNSLKEFAPVKVLHYQDHLIKTPLSGSPSKELISTGRDDNDHLAATFKGFDEANNVRIWKLLQQVDLLHNLGSRKSIKSLWKNILYFSKEYFVFLQVIFCISPSNILAKKIKAPPSPFAQASWFWCASLRSIGPFLCPAPFHWHISMSMCAYFAYFF